MTSRDDDAGRAKTRQRKSGEAEAGRAGTGGESHEGFSLAAAERKFERRLA